MQITAGQGEGKNATWAVQNSLVFALFSTVIRQGLGITQPVHYGAAYSENTLLSSTKHPSSTLTFATSFTP